MTQVLLVSAMAPARPALAAALPALAAAGVSVRACVNKAAYRSPYSGLPTDELHILSPKPRHIRPQPRWSPIRILRAVAWRAGLLRLRRASPAMKPWLLANRDPWFRQAVQESQVIVAMDRLSVYTVWRANRLKGDRRAFYGLTATLRHLSVSPAEVIELPET